MLGCMRVFGRIAAPDVSAFEAGPEVDPAVAGLKTLLATVRARVSRKVNLIRMFTGWHCLRFPWIPFRHLPGSGGRE